MNTGFFITKDILNVFIGIIYFSFIISSIYSIIKLSINLNRILFDKKLVYLFIMFTVISCIQYVYIVLIEELHLNSFIRLLFNTTELSFLAYYVSIIFEKSKIKFWILASLACLFTFLIVLREQFFAKYNGTLVLNLYYAMLSFIIPTSIFIYLIKEKDGIKDSLPLKRPLIMVSLGILTCYLIKVNIHSSLAMIRIYDTEYTFKPISSFPRNITLLTTIELLSFIMLNIFMLRAITKSSNSKIMAVQNRT